MSSLILACPFPSFYAIVRVSQLALLDANWLGDRKHVKLAPKQESKNGLSEENEAQAFKADVLKDR